MPEILNRTAEYEQEKAAKLLVFRAERAAGLHPDVVTKSVPRKRTPEELDAMADRLLQEANARAAQAPVTDTRSNPPATKHPTRLLAAAHAAARGEVKSTGTLLGNAMQAARAGGSR